MHQLDLARTLSQTPTWEAYSALRPLAGFKESTYTGRERKGRRLCSSNNSLKYTLA